MPKNIFNTSVPDYFKVPKTKGEIGIEIEMETVQPFSDEYVPSKDWSIDWEEGSIKGNGAEIVLRQPIARNEVPYVMNTLRERVAVKGLTIKNSIRAGIHIHINCQDMTVGDFLKFMMCYYPLETVFTEFCGENRQGNLFCLRARDAGGMLYYMDQSIKADDLYKMRSDEFRYAAMNMQSMFRYGSLEFRAMATNSELSGVEQWVDILTRIKDYSRKVDNVWDNLTMISGMGPYEWLRGVVGDKYAKLLYYPEMEDDMMEDVRNIQMICNTLSKKGL